MTRTEAEVAAEPTPSDVDPKEPLDALAAAVTAWAEQYGVHPSYADTLVRVARNGSGLVGREDTWLAHLLHASVRTAAATDGAAPQDYLVLTAPDLAIERDGPSTNLPDEVPADLTGLRELLDRRRSEPYYDPAPLALGTLGGLLATAVGSRRTLQAYNRRDVPSRRFPSAGGLQPVDTYVIANRVAGLERGVYFYNPVRHELRLCERGDVRSRLVDAAVHTDWLFYAPVVLALVGNFRRVHWKYGTRGYRLLQVDTGVAVQNLYLTATALGLSSNAVAAFDDDACNDLLRLDGAWEFTNLLFAVGHRISGVTMTGS